MTAAATRLSGLLDADRDPDQEIAWRFDPRGGCDVAIRWADFIARVDWVAGKLAAKPPGPVIVTCEDRFAFAAGLFGAWRANRMVIAPPNGRLGTLTPSTARAVAVISDQGNSASFSERIVLDPDVVTPLGPDLSGGTRALPTSRLLDPAVEALELFGSGTTGDGKEIFKLLGHLEEEVAHLDSEWGGDLANARIFSTLSHQHLYALVVGVLWPLCSGRPFQANTPVHAAEVFPRMSENARFALVSVPSHLRRLSVHRDLPLLVGRCVATFSSGGTLPKRTADSWRETLGVSPIEIFGSTETGAVAWRQQCPGNDERAWTPFSVVQCETHAEDGRLQVRSPFVGRVNADMDSKGATQDLVGERRGSPACDGFTMEDRVRFLPDGRFILEGRRDRVVRIGEKRLSLSSMEQRLRTHTHVSDAKLLALDGRGHSRIGAALVLSAAGVLYRRMKGRHALLSSLRDDLSTSRDPVLLPSVWRIADHFPEDPQGQETPAVMRSIFARQDAELEAHVVEDQRRIGRIERRCVVPEDLEHLKGHFPGRPILPGVLQLQWATEAARLIESSAGDLEAVEDLKFRSFLFPLDPFVIRVEKISETVFGFHLSTDTKVVSSGRLRFSGATGS